MHEVSLLNCILVLQPRMVSAAQEAEHTHGVLQQVFVKFVTGQNLYYLVFDLLTSTSSCQNDDNGVYSDGIFSL